MIALPEHVPVHGHAEFIGSIPVASWSYNAILSRMTKGGVLADTESNAEEFARRAIMLLLSKDSLYNRNVGGMYGKEPVCPTKLQNVVAEVKKLFSTTVKHAATSNRVPNAPHFLIVALNSHFRHIRSNQRSFLFLVLFRFVVDFFILLFVFFVFSVFSVASEVYTTRSFIFIILTFISFGSFH